MVLICNLQQDFSHTLFSPQLIFSLSPSARCCETRSVTVEMCSCWKSADWFDKMLGLQADNGLPTVALCIGYHQGRGSTGLNLLIGWLMKL